MAGSRRRVFAAAVLVLGAMAAGCTEDSPEQDPPPGIFTTTLGDQAPETGDTGTGTPGY